MKSIAGKALVAGDLLSRPIQQGVSNIGTAFFGGDFKATDEMYTPEEASLMSRMFLDPIAQGNQQQFSYIARPEVQGPRMPAPRPTMAHLHRAEDADTYMRWFNHLYPGTRGQIGNVPEWWQGENHGNSPEAFFRAPTTIR